MTLPVLIVNGTIGAGKSTVGLAIHEVLERLKMPHAFLDLDRLTDCYPGSDRFNQAIMFDALAALWPIYASAGAERLVLARVVEARAELAGYSRALGDCAITTVLLRASESTRRKRIVGREFGESLKWHLARSTELEQILTQSDAYDLVVHNETDDPSKAALEILRRAGWVP